MAMSEAAHMLSVQITSVLALVAAIIAIVLMGMSLTKFTKSVIKTGTMYLFIESILIGISMAAMAAYHIFDIDLALDMWHIGILVSLIWGVFITFNFISIASQFSSKRLEQKIGKITKHR